MNLLLTGAWAGAKENIPKLEAMGHQVQFLQQEKDALPCDPAWVEGVVCNGLFQYHGIEQFSNLRLIQLTSAGMDRVPLEEIRRRGIEIHNAAGVYSIPMAEFALAGVLQLYKQSRFFYEKQREHRWEKHRGLLELNGKTVCIVGCGSVGTECAKRFHAFGCRVIGVNRTVPAGFLDMRESGGEEKQMLLQNLMKILPVSEEEQEKYTFYHRIVGLDQLDQILAAADIVVLSIALTGETWHMMNAERLACMKSGSILVNVARGAIVDQEALVECLLQAGTDGLGGAVLDVFEEEPLLEDSLLWDMVNVILTPHNSFVGDGNRGRLDALVKDRIINLE